MQKLSNYNSKAGNGILGNKFQLAGLSMISRIGRSKEYEGEQSSPNFTTKDRFALNGNRLVQWSNGVYGQDGMEYKTEKHNFSRIVSYGEIRNTGCPEYFKVWTKAGLIYEYGATEASRIEGRGRPEASIWLVNKISDTHNNEIHFDYIEDVGNGYYYPYQIRYVLNPEAGITTPTYTIQFYYEDRPDLEEYFLCGSKTLITKRIKKIGIYYNDGTKVRSYTFYYGTNKLSGKSQLEIIRECGRDNKYLNPTTFVWESSKDFEDMNIVRHDNKIPADSLRYSLEYEQHWIEVERITKRRLFYDKVIRVYQLFLKRKFELLKQSQTLNGDMDGDGLEDVIIYKPEDKRLEFYKNSGDYSFGEKTSDIPISQDFVENYTLLALDYNADAFLDFIFLDTITGEHYLYLNKGNANGYENFDISFERFGNITSPSLLQKSTERKYLSFQDFNADGFPDAAIASEKDKEHRLILVNNPSGISLEGNLGNIPKDLYKDEQYFFDFNGDGLVDVLRFNQETKENYWYQNTSSASGISYKLIRKNAISPAILPFDFQFKGADFNGDGMTDLLVYSYSNGSFNNIDPLVLINQGCLIFKQKENYGLFNNFNTTLSPLDFVLAPYDVNGDGSADLINYYNSSGVLTIQINKGDGTFRTPDYRKIISQPINANEIKEGAGLSIVNYRQGALFALKWYDIQTGNTRIFDFEGDTRKGDIEFIDKGQGESIQIDYGYTTSRDVYQRELNPFGKNYPNLDYAGDTKVVSDYTVFSQKGDFKSREEIESKSFNYKHGKINVNGKGFRGFKRFESRDKFKNTKEIIHLNTDYVQGDSPIRKTESITPDGIVYNSIENDYRIDKLTGPAGFSVYNSYLSSSVETNRELNGELISQITRKSQQDDYGNVTFLEIDFGNGYKDVTYSEYSDNQSKWHLGRLTRTEIHRIKEGKIPIIRKANFEYHPETGVLIKEISDPEQELHRKEKAYERDAFGNVTKSSITAWNGERYETRSMVTEYDETGRFNTRTINEAGHIATQEYDPILGKMITKEDVNGNKTHYTYDSLGRTIRVDYPNGVWETTSYYKCGSDDCPFYAEIYIVTRSKINPPFTKYYDSHNREILSESIGFDGKKVNVITEYDEIGRVKRVSDPFFRKDLEYWTDYPERWTEYEYDILDRVIKVTKPGNVVNQIYYRGLLKQYENALGQIKTVQYTPNGQMEFVIDQSGNQIKYEYDLQHNLTAIIDAEDNTVKMEYDLVGNKTLMDDPDMGVYEYTYNRFGEIIHQTYPSGSTIRMEYDALGRPTKKIEEEGETVYEYDTAPNGIAQLAFVNSYAFSRKFEYDTLSRPTKEYQTIEGKEYATSYEYDELGRLEKYHYPSDLSVRYEYDAQNLLRRILNDQTNLVYYELKEVDALGLIHKEQFGNGTETTNSFDLDRKFLMERKTSKSNTTIQDLSYDYDNLQNLLSSTNNFRGYTEYYFYDALNRLTEYEIPDVDRTTVEYDPLGNITFKSDVGHYFYGENGAGPHQLSKIVPVGDNACHAPSLEANYEYTSFNKVKKIYNDSLEVKLTYGDSRQRIVQETYLRNKRIEKKIYVGASMEIAIDDKGIERKKLYLRNNQSVFAVINIETNKPSYTHYWHKDHLGSVQTISDENGEFVEDLAYDPWGLRRNAEDGSRFAFNTSLTNNYDRGYTGHEHIDLFQLINMNGRIHDPVIGRFISPDPFIQDPTNLQNLNRYSYVFNNPLRFIDPSGFMGVKAGEYKSVTGVDGTKLSGDLIALDQFHTDVQRNPNWFSQVYNVALTTSLTILFAPAGPAGAAAAAYISTTATQVLAGQSLKTALKAAEQAALWSGISAAASSVVGVFVNAQAIHSIPALKYTTKIVLHGATQGVIADLQGGKFEHGFLAGAAGAASSAGTNELINRGIITRGGAWNYIAVGLTGGTITSLSGGDFFNGAMTSVTVEFFNNNGPSSTLKRLEEKYAEQFDNMSQEERSAIANDYFSELEGEVEGQHIKDAKNAMSAVQDMKGLSLLGKLRKGALLLADPVMLNNYDDLSLGKVRIWYINRNVSNEIFKMFPKNIIPTTPKINPNPRKPTISQRY